MGHGNGVNAIPKTAIILARSRKVIICLE